MADEMKPITQWQYADAKQAVETAAHAAAGTDGYAANAAYVEAHDFWQEGDAWVGPNGDGNGEVWAGMRAGIERQLAPVDVIGEALGRVANALLKTEASVTFVPLAPEGKDGAPSEAQQREADAMRRAVATWWDRVKLWELARATVKRSRWSGRGALRLWIAEGHLHRDEDGTLRLETGLALDEAFARVQLSDPLPDAAAIVIDPVTLVPSAVVLRTLDGKPAAEVWTVTTDATGTPQLEVRLIPQQGDPRTSTLRLPRLPVAEMTAEVLITDPVRRLQNRLTFAESTVTRSAETSGFPERHALNAEPHGVWVSELPADGVYAASRDGADGNKEYLIETQPTLGASVLTRWIGIQTGPANAEGEAPRATPGLVIKEPTDPEYVLKTCRHGRAAILAQCHQAHVLRESDRNISGYSQEQAREDFVTDATNTKGPLEGMLRDTIEGAVGYALAMAAGGDLGEVTPDFLARYRCVVTVQVDPGPLSDGERRAILEEYEKGLRSRLSTMTLLGVEDPDAELGAIDGDERAKLARITAYATALTAVAAIPGGSVDAAARAMKTLQMDAALVDALVPRDTDGGTGEEDGDEEDEDEREDAA